MERHNIYLPRELWERMRKAALAESNRQGRVVSVSEWLRDLLRRALKVDQPRK